jgi:hypothetical protein
MPSVKEIYSRISDVTIDADSINLNTDTVESLLSTVQADIALVKTDIANGVLSDVRDGTGNAITSTVSGAKRSLDVTAINQNLTTGTGTASGTLAVGTEILPSTDASGFSEITIQFTGTWPAGGIAQFQISNDNTTFANQAGIQVGQTSPTANVSAIGIYKITLAGARYFRVRVGTQGASSSYDYSYAFNPRSSFNSTQPVNIVSSTALTISPSTGNGFSTHHTAISAATTNATNVKSGVPSIGSMIISNTSASIRYFKIFNLTVAPTMGTSTPVLNYAIMPNSTMAIDCSFAGTRLSSGLSYAITAGQALLDNTAVGAGDVVVNISYA